MLVLVSLVLMVVALLDLPLLFCVKAAESREAPQTTTRQEGV